ncbi:MAG: hypothetical protein QXL94_03355 [Candidatus Parvarchaeum sp.]
MNKNTAIGLTIGSAVGAGIIALILSRKPTPVTSTTTPSTTTSPSTSSGSSLQSLFLGITPSYLTLGANTSITVTDLSGAPGTSIKIVGLPSALTVVTDSSGFASTTYTPTKVGSYTVYAQLGNNVSNSVTLVVSAQCANNSQCPAGQMCSGGKCVPCPIQTCPCGKTWSTSSCSCTAQTPAKLEFTSPEGVTQDLFAYENNYSGYMEIIPTIIYNAILVAYLQANLGTGQLRCAAGNAALPYTSSPTQLVINGHLADSNGLPMCNQSVSIGISGNVQPSKDSFGDSYETAAYLSNANPGASTINVTTDTNGNFTVSVWVFAKLTNDPGSFSGMFPTTITGLLLSGTELYATYGNLTAQALINYTGNFLFCT